MLMARSPVYTSVSALTTSTLPTPPVVELLLLLLLLLLVSCTQFRSVPTGAADSR